MRPIASSRVTVASPDDRANDARAVRSTATVLSTTSEEEIVKSVEKREEVLGTRSIKVMKMAAH